MSEKMKIRVHLSGGQVELENGDGPDHVNNLAVLSAGENSIVIAGTADRSISEDGTAVGRFKAVELLAGHPVRDLNPDDPNWPVPDDPKHRRISIRNGLAYVPNSDQEHWLAAGEWIVIDGEEKFRAAPDSGLRGNFLYALRRSIDTDVYKHPRIEQALKCYTSGQICMQWDLDRYIRDAEQTLLGSLEQGPQGAKGWWHSYVPRCGEPYGWPYDALAWIVLAWLRFDGSQEGWDFVLGQLVTHAAVGYEPLNVGKFSGMPRYSKGYASMGDFGNVPYRAYMFPRGLAWGLALTRLMNGGVGHFALEEAWLRFRTYLDRENPQFYADLGHLYGIRDARRYVDACLIVHDIENPGEKSSKWLDKAEHCVSTMWETVDPVTGIVPNATADPLDPKGVASPWMQGSACFSTARLFFRHKRGHAALLKMGQNCLGVIQHGMVQRGSVNGGLHVHSRYRFGMPIDGSISHPVHTAETVQALRVLAGAYPNSNWDAYYRFVLNDVLDNIGNTRWEMDNGISTPVSDIQMVLGKHGAGWGIKNLPKYLELMLL